MSYPPATTDRWTQRPTLAEFLSRQGYATAGFVANTVFCAAETGLNRGFEHYDDHVVSVAEALQVSALGRRVLLPLGRGAIALADNLRGRSTRVPDETKDFKNANTINRLFLDWLTEHQNGPFFAFLNYFDAHTPYLLPDGYEYRFGRPIRSCADRTFMGRWWLLDKREFGADEVQLAIDAYDSCIAYLDEQLGRLFAELECRGVLRDTIVIVTADHGEHLGEHQLFGHAGSLYDPEVHVPLLIVAPDCCPRTGPSPNRSVCATCRRRWSSFWDARVRLRSPDVRSRGFWGRAPTRPGPSSPRSTTARTRMPTTVARPPFGVR